MLKKSILFISFLTSIYVCSGDAFSQTYIDDSFEDFSKGELDASGQNLYISKKGDIRVIRRFDLNNDGFIDLLFNSTHNDDVTLPASLMSVSGDGQFKNGQIQIEGSVSSVSFDLNKDGYQDLVFCPQTQYGAQTPRRLVSIVYGTKDGWNPNTTNGLLPTNGVKDIAIADLNDDTWPDIVTLNSSAWLPGQPGGNIARIYWGGKDGYLLTRYQDVGVGGAFKMISADFDLDKSDDIAFLTSKNTIKLLWGNKDESAILASKVLKPDEWVYDEEIKLDFITTEILLPGKRSTSFAAADLDDDSRLDFIIGDSERKLHILSGDGRRGWSPQNTIQNVRAASISTSDLDNDGNLDIVVSPFSPFGLLGTDVSERGTDDDDSVQIFWGKNGVFSSSNISHLQSPYTVATGVADLNGDGQNDIVCAVYQGDKTYAAESIVFFGKKNKKFERSINGIPSSGAHHVTVIPSHKNHPTNVLISNSRAGNLDEELPLMIYPGSANGFKVESLIEIPFNSGYESSAADLNEDGYVDLIAVNAMHAGQADNPYRGINIFWGTKDGFDIKEHRTVLNENNASTSNVADLNKDGYLDLIVGFFDHSDKSPTRLVIYYGSELGYEPKNRVALLAEGRSSSPTIADYNKDGWLDILIVSHTKDVLRIFWGSVNGFSEEKQQIIPLPAAIDVETADLNDDGYLDIIASSYMDKVNRYHDTGVTLFWGSADGFKGWNSQWLQSSTVLGPVAADFDNDGHLDLFLPSYHSEITRDALPNYLYWGGIDGFSKERRTTFILDSGADGLAADFNKDGLLDLAVASHADDRTHSKAISKVYYNDGQRFQSAGLNLKTENLPSTGGHWIWNYDLGHIYNRRAEQSYVSSIKKLNGNVKKGEISYKVSTPAESSFKLFVRTSSDEDSLGEMEWRTIENDEFTVNEKDSYLQYKFSLISGNGDSYPIIQKVILKLE